MLDSTLPSLPKLRRTLLRLFDQNFLLFGKICGYCYTPPPASMGIVRPNYGSNVQMRTVPSLLAVTTFFPSGEKAADMTSFVCPSKIRNTCPDSASQTRAVLSQLAVTSFFPSGEKATHETELVCSINLRNSFPDRATRGLLHEVFLYLSWFLDNRELVVPSAILLHQP